MPADVVATVMVLQALEGLSDREAISAQLSSHDRLSGTNKVTEAIFDRWAD